MERADDEAFSSLLNAAWLKIVSLSTPEARPGNETPCGEIHRNHEKRVLP
jgi:hypothetical protein